MQNRKTYTPGEWRRWNSGYTGCPDVIFVGEKAPTLHPKTNKLQMNGSLFIAEVSTQHMELDAQDNIIQHDNGSLVLAAPDMARALQMCIRCMDGPRIPKYMEEPVKQARAALAKAKVLP